MLKGNISANPSDDVSGWQGNGYSCQDVDECLTNNGGCSSSPLVQCLNTMGSFHCGPCPPGMQKKALSSLELKGSSLIARHLTTSYLIYQQDMKGMGKHAHKPMSVLPIMEAVTP